MRRRRPKHNNKRNSNNSMPICEFDAVVMFFILYCEQSWLLHWTFNPEDVYPRRVRVPGSTQNRFNFENCPLTSHKKGPTGRVVVSGKRDYGVGKFNLFLMVVLVQW